MARLTDEAIVLRRWEYSETSQTVSALSRSHGIVRGLAKGAMRQGSAFSGGFEPMTRGHVGWIEKPSRELSILTEWMPSDVYWATRRSRAANASAIYAIDLVSRLLQDHDPHVEVFEALDAALKNMSTPPSASSHLLRFQWVLLDAIGWRPSVECDATTGDPLPEDVEVVGFRTSAGGVVSHPAEHDWRVRRETIDLLRDLAIGRVTLAGDADVAVRASGLLAVYTRDLLGEASEAMRLAFPSLA